MALSSSTQEKPTTRGVETLPDSEVVRKVTECAARERHATADLLRVLIEFDRRQLYLAEGYPSLFAYCTQALHYSEHAAFNRIEVARAAAKWPQLLACIEDGSLHLAGARLIAPHLTEENVELALESARHKSKRDIEEVAARLARRNLLVAVAAEQYRLHLTISREARDLLREVQELISHQVPEADPAVIFEQALLLLRDKLQRQRAGKTSRPRTVQPGASRKRHVPAQVRRQVWERDGGRCAFVGRQGRCPERRFLEFHHVVPFAAGGTTTTSNIELRCRSHNTYEAHQYFGPDAVAAARARRKAAGAKGPERSHGRTRPGTSSRKRRGAAASG